MYRKLFGETVEEQERYLKIRVIVSAIAIVALLLDALFFKAGFGPGICVIALLMWGWSLLKALWGVTSFFSLFSLGYSFVVTIIILVVYIMIGYLAGFLIFPIGIYRYISIFSGKAR